MMEKILNGARVAELWAAVKAYVDARPGGDVNPSYLLKAPVGTIVIWSGAAENVPNGWALCDGQDGRPDLRDRFVLGTGDKHAVGETGGSESIRLTLDQLPNHSHTIHVGTASGSASFQHIKASSGSTPTYNGSGIPSAYTGGSAPHPNIPPYYTLAYIMKL